LTAASIVGTLHGAADEFTRSVKDTLQGSRRFFAD
jgi:hypothetical protein